MRRVLAGFSLASVALTADAVVISQVFGGGGNTGAPYQNDYVVLFNDENGVVTLTGWSLQYASAAGTGYFGSNPVTLLMGALQPGEYFLVQEAGGATGAALPTPDATGTANLSATSGKIALVNSTTGVACNGGSTPCTPAQLAQFVDLVGYGGANFFEGAGAAPGLSNTTAAFRIDSGCTDTDSNIADFSVGAPNPFNRASAMSPCATYDFAPRVVVTNPTNGATSVPANANITIGFSEPVDVVDSWFDISGSVSGALSATVTGGPMNFFLDPLVDFDIGGESVTVSVFANLVSDRSFIPNKMAADFTFQFRTLAGTPVPEPATLALLGLGLAGVAATRRRKH